LIFAVIRTILSICLLPSSILSEAHTDEKLKNVRACRRFSYKTYTNPAVLVHIPYTID
jgi:hypothetical protein